MKFIIRLAINMVALYAAIVLLRGYITAKLDGGTGLSNKSSNDYGNCWDTKLRIEYVSTPVDRFK